MSLRWFSTLIIGDMALVVLLHMFSAWQFTAWATPSLPPEATAPRTLAEHIPNPGVAALTLGVLIPAGAYGVLQT